jgi:hypothetical protein
MKYILAFLITISFLEAICQDNLKDTVIFRDGMKAFTKLVGRGINKYDSVNNLRHLVYVNANMTITSEGKIKQIDFFSVDDTLFSNILYNVLMQTDGGWLNPSKEDQIFSIYFEFRYAENSFDKVAPINYHSDVYENGKLKKITRFGPFVTTVFPTVH